MLVQALRKCQDYVRKLGASACPDFILALSSRLYVQMNWPSRSLFLYNRTCLRKYQLATLIEHFFKNISLACTVFLAFDTNILCTYLPPKTDIGIQGSVYRKAERNLDLIIKLSLKSLYKGHQNCSSSSDYIVHI